MPGEQRRLRQFRSRRVDAEVGAGGVLHAEGAVAERHQVQVAGEDFRFGEHLVEGQRHPDLAQLACRRGLDRGTPLGVGLGVHQQVEVLDVLLLDRRPTPDALVAAQVAGQAGQRSLPVDAVVLD